MKKIISAVLVLSLMMAFSVSALAAAYVNGDLSYDEGGKVYVPTPEDEAIRAAILNSPALFSPIFVKTLNVTAFLQDNGHYCGPATVKQTLHYINGNSSSQSTYATALGTTTAGTDMTVIPCVLNNNQSSHDYVYSSFSNISTWITYLRSALSANVPAIADINTIGSVWPYETTGHFVNLSGLNYDSEDGPGLNTVLVTDPYQPGFGNHWYSMTTVYNVNANHSRSAIIH